METTKEQLDVKAVEMVIKSVIHKAIMGTFGNDDGDEMFHKMHTIIEVADKLLIKNLNVTISLKELREEKKKFEEEVIKQLDSDD